MAACNCEVVQTESCPECGSLNTAPSYKAGWVECGECPSSRAYLRPVCEVALIAAAREMRLKGNIFSIEGRRFWLGLQAAQEFLHQEKLSAIPEDTTYLHRMTAAGLHEEAREAYRAFAKFLEKPTRGNEAIAAAKYVAIGGMLRPY